MAAAAEVTLQRHDLEHQLALVVAVAPQLARLGVCHRVQHRRRGGRGLVAVNLHQRGRRWWQPQVPQQRPLQWQQTPQQ